MKIHSADGLRIVTPFRINTECSNAEKWIQHEILSMLKNKMTPKLNCDLCCHREGGSGRGHGRGQGQGWD